MNKPSDFSHNPKISLTIALLICATVLLQMGYNVLHQIKDVPFDSDITPLMMSTIRDALFNHEIFINAFIAYSLIILSYQTIKQIFLYRSWGKFVSSNELPELSIYYTEKNVDLNCKVKVVSDSRKIAVTSGLFKPYIVLSTGLINHFNDEKLNAIILHESFHCLRRHPLHNVMLCIGSKSLIYVPIVKELVQYYQIWMELNADRFAIAKMGSESPLGHVLLDLIKNQTVKTPGYGVHFSHTAINYRIQQLMDPERRLQVMVFRKKALYASLIVPVLMGIIIIMECI
ncbi:hypothetical protein AK95_25625 [Paenibacillus sp. LC231]|jgi:Zn-dependent protease with chaperone function|uniref:M56 family peptidase n=1 Tax=Paenibacillus lautus TaxID=1401 RepID=A0A385U3L9_PAELA|nr:MULTISPECIES: M56 family metallopeptidase [Paenibacillus]AWP25112.1 hypothetical protein B9D94_00025 [Paenibacillus sp. Cedars]AYB48165.1 M56 family peptidase [Paenibacillus lautus]MBX4152498.1 M56 family metallopeptidase [Paenibacillus lautus]OIB00559.1 hypothetical protein AK95_25625 [Paenibacillus sp. LC231]